MLGWILVFLLAGVVAGVLGFGGIATFAVDIAQLLFFVFLVLLILSILIHVLRGRGPL